MMGKAHSLNAARRRRCRSDRASSRSSASIAFRRALRPTLLARYQATSPMAGSCIRGRSNPSTSPGEAWRGRNFREGTFMPLLPIGLTPNAPMGSVAAWAGPTFPSL